MIPIALLLRWSLVAYFAFCCAWGAILGNMALGDCVIYAGSTMAMGWLALAGHWSESLTKESK